MSDMTVESGDTRQPVSPDHPHFAKARSWEATEADRKDTLIRILRKVVGGLVVAVVCLGALLVMLFPLKESVPFLVRVNNATGVPDIVTALDSKTEKYDDVIDKYFLAKYVEARETYDWYTIQRDYEAIGLMSSADVAKEYATLFEGKDALDKKLGATTSISIEIVSVVPNDRAQGIGTVRFIRRTGRTDNPNDRTATNEVATIGYQYRNNAKLLESARLINPLGFTVTSYRRDPENGGVR